MKKVLLVLALVAAYGVSIAMNSSNMVTVDETNQITVVADEKAPNAEKEKAEKAKAKTAKADGKADGCSGSKAKAKADGCSGSKAKADGCSGSKEKAKSDCGGDKKK